MTKKTLLVLASSLALLGSHEAVAQTKDITFVVAPSAGYTFWNNKLNLGDSPFWGVRAGFGIGSTVELRALYEQSYDLKGKLQGSGWSPISSLGNSLEGSSANIKRIGGEIKINIFNNRYVTPYLTAGAGVMKIKYDDTTLPSGYKEEQLYGSLGAGIKINLARRIALSLEAKDHIFNIDNNNRYLAAGASSSNTLHNFGAQASLDFYLGGTAHSDDAVSRAYRRHFGDGFRGMKVVLEPAVASLHFHDESLLNDTYMIGGNVGVDFNQYLGLRGFYYQSTIDRTKLSHEINSDLKMYGGKLNARLNVARGVTPYLTIGGGYLKVGNDYVDRLGANDAKSGWFAMGGAGLEIPLHRIVALYGEANAMLLEQDNDNIRQATNPSNVRASWMFQGGLRFNIGAASRSGAALYRGYAEEQVRNTEAEYNNRLNELRSNYERRIDSLNQDLLLAAKRLDTLEVERLAVEKRAVKEQQLLNEAEAIEAPIVAPLAEPVINNQPKIVTLTKSQLEELINSIVSRQSNTTASQSLSDFDRLLLLSALRNGQINSNTAQLLPLIQALNGENKIDATLATPSTSTSYETNEILRRLNELESRLEQKIDNKLERADKQLKETAKALTKEQKQTRIDLQQEIEEATDYVNSRSKDRVAIVNPTSGKTKFVDLDSESFLKFESVDLMIGANYADAFGISVGARPQWQMGKSAFSLAPDFFYSPGSKGGYALSANVLYKPASLKLGQFSPYAGLGFGFGRFNGDGKAGVTTTIGAHLDNILGGRFFVDYSMRPVASVHILSAGYTLKF